MRRTLLGVCSLPLTWILLASQVWSDELSPPQDVHLDSVLRWRPATEHPQHVKYTAQYLIFDGGAWQDVPGCVQTELTSCNISSIPVSKRRPCVRLCVHAAKGRQSSRPVEAYSLDKSCSPVFTLTPLPGSLAVHMWNNSLSYQYGGHAQYNIIYSRNGHGKEMSASSSVTIKDLEVGDHVCVEVQYTLYQKPYGPPSQKHCELIPVSEKDYRNKIVIICVVVLCIVAPLALASAYLIIKKHEKIKQLLRPPICLPDHIQEFLSQPFSVPPQIQSTSNSEESYDQITLILPLDDELDGVQGSQRT